MKRPFILIILALSISSFAFGQDSLWQKSYQIAIYNNYDLRNSSNNMISAFHLLNDGVSEGLISKMNPKIGNVTKAVFNLASIYLTMLWTHEFGHSLRAKQVEGNFNIHNFGLPIPYTTADLPASISLEDEAIFVTAGFEANYLSVRDLQSQFIRQNGIYNEDLALAFANNLMYPIYTSIVVPINPKEREVWIETAGDPVHYILPVFKNFSDNAVFMADSTVNPELISFYNQATIFATFFQFINPQFYRELGAAFGKSSKVRRPIFLIGDFENGWTYSTLFNASPLGYELYFQNYIHLKGQQFAFYLKYGRPFKNIGLGISMNNVLNFKHLTSDLIVECWQQDLFAEGISIESQTKVMLSEKIGINLIVGYKTEGYLLGKQLQAGPNLGFGIAYYRN